MRMVRHNVADIVSTGTEISDLVPRHHINKSRINIKVRAYTLITDITNFYLY
jgi:hypothetical protein